MSSSLRAHFARFVSLSVLSATLSGCIGCGCVVVGGCSGVQQDRTITVSHDGSQVAVQHDRDGIFVADSETGEITKIFDPPQNVVAASSPLWSPHDKRLIFATAVSPSQAAPVDPPTDNPDGRIVYSGPVDYTCWLRPVPGQDGDANPQPLFKSRCAHAGYVAANLALRWSPDGNGILYVKQSGQSDHELWQFDIATGKSRRVFPHAAPALVVDWSPNNNHLVCLLSGGDTTFAGIWIGKPESDDWWQVPGSAIPQVPLQNPLESARAARPAWSRDSKRFAFAINVLVPFSADNFRFVGASSAR
jgi:WD40 repeat protein